MCTTVLQLRNLGLWIGLAGPLFVRQPLALAVAINADEIVRCRRVDAALLGHLRQHFAIGLAIVPPHDRAQRGIGLHRRGVDADPLALDQALLGHMLQHPAEHLLVDLMGEAARPSSTTTSDREPSPGSPAAGNRAATSNPNTAKRCPVRWRSPQNNQPCASGTSPPAPPTARP